METNFILVLLVGIILGYLLCGYMIQNPFLNNAVIRAPLTTEAPGTPPIPPIAKAGAAFHLPGYGPGGEDELFL